MKYIKILLVVFCLLALFLRYNALSSHVGHFSFPESIEGRRITYSDVYYLAKSIDDSLVSMHNLYTVFDRERIADNIKPRNVYQRAIINVDEFVHLHKRNLGHNSIDLNMLRMMKEYSHPNIEASKVYGALILIKDHLAEDGNYIEYEGKREVKNLSDVYRLLREISFHHLEIVNKRNPIKWNQPIRVYELNLFEVQSLLCNILRKHNVEIEPFSFPLKPKEEIKPKDVYGHLMELHKKLSIYYKAVNTSYKPIILVSPTKINEITPNDVYDLTQILLGDLKNIAGNPPVLKKEVAISFYNWKNKRKDVVPGDVYNLIDYNLMLADKIVENIVGKNMNP